MATITIQIDDKLHAQFIKSVGGEDPLSAITDTIVGVVSDAIRKAAVNAAVNAANAGVDELPFDSIQVKAG